MCGWRSSSQRLKCPACCGLSISADQHHSETVDSHFADFPYFAKKSLRIEDSEISEAVAPEQHTEMEENRNCKEGKKQVY